MNDVSARELAAMAEVDGSSQPLDDSVRRNPITREEREPFERVARLNRLIAEGHHRSDPIRPGILAMVESHRRARMETEQQHRSVLWVTIKKALWLRLPAIHTFVLGILVSAGALTLVQPHLIALLPSGIESGVAVSEGSGSGSGSIPLHEEDRYFTHRATAASSNISVSEMPTTRARNEVESLQGAILPEWATAYIKQNPNSDLAKIVSDQINATGRTAVAKNTEGDSNQGEQSKKAE